MKFRFPVVAAIAAASVSSLSVTEAHAAIACLNYSGSNSGTASSWLAGAQAGYNWQRGALVYGLETDLSLTELKSQLNGGLVGVSSCIPAPTANTTSSVDWFGTVRGRVGATYGQFLFYGTGGLAYGKVRLSSNFDDPDPGADPTSNLQTSSIRAGWVVGGGIEYMLRPNWILNVGYQHIDLGTVSLAGSASSPGGFKTINQTASARASFDVVTVGLSWRFGLATSGMDAMASGMPTKASTYKTPSNPWDGLYFGVHGGGAWGNKTNGNYSSTTTLDPE